MKTRWIAVCFIVGLLSGCANYEQNEIEYLPVNPKSSSPCRAIKQQLNVVSSPELDPTSVYPPSQYNVQPTAIQKARLLREYQYYGCQN